MAFLTAFLTFFIGHTALGQAGGTFNPDANDGKAQDIKPQDVIHWEALDAEVKGASEIVVGARLTVNPGWSIYVENLSFSGPTGFSVTKVVAPKAKTVPDPMTGKDTQVYEGGEFFVTLAGPIDGKQDTFPFSARYVGCTKVICLFPHAETMAARVQAKAEPAPPPAVAPPAKSEPAVMVGGGDEDLETQWAARLKSGTLSFGTILLLVFLGGLLSNLTPCVYPMIPITLRLLSRQGHSPHASAAVYASGIVVTYTALGLAAALSGGMFGSLLASKAFNGVFAVFMIGLGVTMLGFGDFSKVQMVGNRLGSGKPSLGNTFLMGAGAGLVAAPCTGPILAFLLAYAAGSDKSISEKTLLLAVYSLGFGLPYVFLGGAAARMSQVKVGPAVQIGVKLLFASVMFALGLYYLRIPFYGVLEQMRPYWSAVAPAALGVGLVLSVLWVVMPALQNKKLGMVLPTAILGLGLFALSQKLTQSPGNTGTADAHASATWYRSEADAFAAAARSGKPLLIDMWAEWCEACKKMDNSTFADPVLLEVLAKDWVLLKTDLTESSDQNDKIQEKYGLQSLPTLVLLPATADVARRRNITGFVSAATLLNNLTEFKAKAAE